MEAICWLLLAAIFIVIEIITLGLTTIWFAGGAFVAAIAGACGANLIVQVVLFLVVSIVLLVLTRPLAVKHLDSKTEKTNAEALVGQSAVVLQEIDNLKETGQAKINGMEWTARAKEDSMIIPAGTAVRIVEIQGVKLIVERAEYADETGTQEL
ncbi:MAG: NfeD family protein [Lachnospiraceae bacterium]